MLVLAGLADRSCMGPEAGVHSTMVSSLVNRFSFEGLSVLGWDSCQFIEDNLGLISSVCKHQSHLQSTFMSARRLDSVAVFSIGC